MSEDRAKSILRTRPSTSYPRKNAKFDELNILQTLHTLEKEIVGSRFEEPKTPFVFKLIGEHTGDQFPDPEILTHKLRLAANTQTPSFGDESLSDDEFPETDEEKIHRIVFEKRRKAHYNEYAAVELARKLIEKDLANLEENETDENSEIVVSSKCSSSARTEEQSSENEETESGNTASAYTLDKPIFIEKVKKPKDVEDTLDPTHPCYGKIKKNLPQPQQQQEQQQQEQQQQEEQQQQQQDDTPY